MQNGPWLSALDGLGNALGYSVVLIGVALVRELLWAQVRSWVMRFCLPWPMAAGISLMVCCYWRQARSLLSASSWAIRAWKTDQVEEAEYEIAPNVQYKEAM